MNHTRTRRSVLALVAMLLLGHASPVAAQDAPPAPSARYDGHALVRVTLRSAADIARALEISGDVWSESIGIGEVDFRIPPGGLAELRDAGLPHRVLIDDIQPLIDEQMNDALLRGGAWFDDYHPHGEISDYLDTLVALRPDLASREFVGESLESNDIFAIRITAPGGDDKPAVLLNGCQHAREWISPATCMYIADRLVRDYDTDPAINDLLDRVEIIIVPVVNPDGYIFTWGPDRLWRKNRRVNGDGTRGVDLNRNWAYGWGGPGSSGSGSSEVYRGPAPFSEPESAAMRNYILANPDIAAHIDFHSFSQLVLSPWGWTFDPAPDASLLNGLADDMADAIFDVHGSGYTAGPAASTLYEASGVAPDWSYGERGILGWTIELRDTGEFGFLLPADQIVPTGEEAFAAVRALADYLTVALSFDTPLGLPGAAEAGTTTPVTVSITPGFGQTIEPGSPRLFARIGAAGAFADSPLTPIGGDLYEGTLPAAGCGLHVQFYFQAATAEGAVETFPAEAGDAPLSVQAFESTAAFSDAFEADTGWTVGDPGDTASTGVWERVEPVGTDAQPGEDNPAGVGTRCFITGNGEPGGGLGDNDVDGGATTLTSPALDCTGDGDAYISYYRWYSNNQGASPNSDSMPVLISNDNGQTWTELELVTENAGAWVRKAWRIADFVEPTSAVRLRFVARDESPGSIVEAGVDDVEVTLLGCSTPSPDLDGDGDVDGADLAVLLGLWGTGGGAADLNGDGETGGADLAVLLGAWTSP